MRRVPSFRHERNRSERAPRRADRGGHERVARPACARADRLRRAGADGRAGLAARRDVQPGDLREVDPRLGGLRLRPQAPRRRGQDRARDLPRDGAARRARGLRRAAAGLRRDERRGRLRLLGGRAAARARHRGDDRAGPHVLGARRPPEPDDQDPGHRGRAAGDRAVPVRRDEHQRHAAVQGRPVRARHGGVRRAGWSAAWRPAGRSTATRSRRSSSRAWTPRSTSGSRRSATRSCRAAPGSPTRAPPTRRSSGSSRASASRSCARRAARCSARCGPRPASRTRTTRRRSTSGGSSRRTRSTRCRCRRCEAAKEQGGVTGATAAEDPSADLEALAAAGIDLEDVTDQLLREGIDAFMVPMQKLLDGIESKRTAIAA